MAIAIVVPQMGESVVEGTIGRWLKAEGESVMKDETIVEIMTDKINVEVPAIDGGVLGQIVAPEGTVVAIGAEIGYIVAEGESLPAEIGGRLHEPAVAQAAVGGSDDGGGTAVMSPPVERDRGAGRPRTSPVVRRLLREHKLNIEQIPGTGAGGRVTRNDVLTFIRTREEAPAAVMPSAPGPMVTDEVTPPPRTREAYAPHAHVDTEETERIPFAGVRKVIADHMVHSKHTSAHVMTMDEVDLTELVRVREARKAEWRERTGANVTYMPFLVKAAVAALKEFPTINASVDGDQIVLKKYYHIGVAVARDDGLIVPVVRHADKKSIVQIARELGELADRARRDALDLPDISGSTFTVTNAGMFGALASTPVINQPELCILGVHKIQQRPVVRDGAIVIRDMMYLTVSFDHRIIDGHTAVQFLRRLIERLEDPYELLLTIG